MIRVDPMENPRLNEGLIQLAIADYVQWWRVLVVPNWCYWHEMDVAVLTRAGCLHEYEIKVSQADWERDGEKDAAGLVPPWVDQMDDPEKWRAMYGRPRRNLTHVREFTYVYAKGLQAPAFVPEWAGLIQADFETHDGAMYVALNFVRGAKARNVEKPPERAVRKMYESVYHRFWGQLKALPIAELVALVSSASAPEGALTPEESASLD